MKPFHLFSTIALFCSVVAALVAAGDTKPVKVEGVLLDQQSSYIAETRVVADGRLEGGMLQAYMHTKKDLLAPENVKSGYGVYTYEQKYLTFDAAGNAKALALIRTATKTDDFRVEVTGTVDGDKIKVAAIRLLP